MQLSVDLSALPLVVREKVNKNIHHSDAAQYVLAAVEQAKMAKLVRDVMKPGVNTGIGPMTSIIHPYFYAQMQRLHGEKIFMDPEFVPWLQKEDDCTRVPDVGTKVQVGYTGRNGFKRRNG